MSARRNKMPGPPPNEAWVWHTIILLASMAWRDRSHALVRVIDQLEIEHLHHGGQENGHLVLTFDDIERAGVRRKSIAPAIREGECRGLIMVRRGGRDFGSGKRQPNRYRLTYLPWREDRHSGWQQPSDEWKRYVTPEARPRPKNRSGERAPTNLKTQERKRHQIRGDSATTKKSNGTKFNEERSGEDATEHQGQERSYFIYLGGEGHAAGSLDAHATEHVETLSDAPSDCRVANRVHLAGPAVMQNKSSAVMSKPVEPSGRSRSGDPPLSSSEAQSVRRALGPGHVRGASCAGGATRWPKLAVERSCKS